MTDTSVKERITEKYAARKMKTGKELEKGIKAATVLRKSIRQIVKSKSNDDHTEYKKTRIEKI